MSRVGERRVEQTRLICVSLGRLQDAMVSTCSTVTLHGGRADAN